MQLHFSDLHLAQLVCLSLGEGVLLSENIRLATIISIITQLVIIKVSNYQGKMADELWLSIRTDQERLDSCA